MSGRMPLNGSWNQDESLSEYYQRMAQINTIFIMDDPEPESEEVEIPEVEIPQKDS